MASAIEEVMRAFKRGFARVDRESLARAVTDDFEWHLHWFDGPDDQPTGRVLRGLDEVMAEIERRRTDLSLGLLRVYNYYRVLIGLLLIAVVSQDAFASSLGALNPVAFYWGALVYTGINLASALAVQTFPQRYVRGPALSLTLVGAMGPE